MEQHHDTYFMKSLRTTESNIPQFINVDILKKIQNMKLSMYSTIPILEHLNTMCVIFGKDFTTKLNKVCVNFKIVNHSGRGLSAFTQAVS